MKFSSILLLLLLTVSTAFAQKDDDESVKTYLLTFPAYDIQNTDPSSFTASFALGKSNYGDKKMHENKSVCAMVDGNDKIKDLKEVTVYFYNIQIQRDESYLVIKDNAGKIIFSTRLTDGSEKGEKYFGYNDDCKYWLPKLLEDDYTAKKGEWETADHEEYKNQLFKQAYRLTQSKLSLVYVEQTVTVYSAKGGSHDYTDLDQAQKQALDTYAKIKTAGINQEIFDELAVPIQTWMKYADAIDWENNKAKVNKKVGKGVLINLITAFMYRFELDKAMEYARIAEGGASSGLFDDKGQIVQDLMEKINQQYAGIEANKDISTNFPLLNEKAQGMASKIEVKDMGADMVAALHFDNKEFLQEEKGRAMGDKLSDGTQDNRNNPYNKYISETPKGVILTVFIFDEELKAFPVEITTLPVNVLRLGGQSMKSIPPEIGNMTALTEMDISANEFSEIPEEIGNCVNLETLNLSRNGISALPESFKQLTKLKSLNIKKTKISAAEAGKIQGWLPNCQIKK